MNIKTFNPSIFNGEKTGKICVMRFVKNNDDINSIVNKMLIGKCKTDQNMGFSIIKDEFVTTAGQNNYIKMVTNQLSPKYNPDEPKATLIDEEKANRFLNLIKKITGTEIFANPNQGKAIINKEKSVTFLDQEAEKGGVLIKVIYDAAEDMAEKTGKKLNLNI